LPPVTTFPVGAAPGWRPDPARPGQERLWDGSHWTEHVRSLAPEATDGPPAPATPGRALSVVIQVLLGAVAVLHGILLVYSIHAGSVVAIWQDRPESSEAAERGLLTRLGLTLDFGAVGLLALTGVLFLVWLARRYTDPRVNRTLLRRTPTMAVLCWFLPIVQLWWPAQCVKDLWHASRPEARAIIGPVRHPMPAIMWPWWLGWLLRSATTLTPVLFLGGTPPTRELTFALPYEPFGFAFSILSACCLIVIINQIEEALVAVEPTLAPGSTLAR